MKRILVIQTASIGDVILATPVLEKLRASYPDAAIDLLIKKGTESLFESHPFLRTVYVWDKKDGKYKNWQKILKQVRSNEYDLVVNIQRFFSMSLFTVLSKAKHTVGFSKSPLSFLYSKRLPHAIGKKGEAYQHEVERNLSLIEHLTDNSFVRPKLYPSDKQFEEVLQYKTEKYICIAPASLWFTKQFPKEKWVEFIDLLDSSLRIYFLGGMPDSALCDEIIASSHNKNAVNLSGKLTLLASAALMRDAEMNYVNDSSPMHLASSMNANTTAIFCSTIPEFGFGPLSENNKIVQENIPLACRPCGLHGHKECPEKHFSCAMSIDCKRIL